MNMKFYVRPEAVELDPQSLFILCVSQAGGSTEEITYDNGGEWGGEE